MVILIFSVSLSIGTGLYLPDPDLIQTGLAFPLSISATSRIKSVDLYTSANLIPAGADDYSLDFYLLNVGLILRKGIIETRLGAGVGGIKRALGSDKEKGFCYDFSALIGPKFPIYDFSLFPALDFKLVSDTDAYTWIIGLGMEIGYEIP